MAGFLPLRLTSRLATESGGRQGWLTPPDEPGPVPALEEGTSPALFLAACPQGGSRVPVWRARGPDDEVCTTRWESRGDLRRRHVPFPAFLTARWRTLT